MPKKSKVTQEISDRVLIETLKKHKGNQTEAGKELGVHRSTICRRLKNRPDLGITLLDEINAAAEELGIDAKSLMAKLLEGADAGVIFEGAEIKDTPNHAERRKNVETLAKILGYIKSGGTNVQVNVQQNTTTISDEVKRIEDEQKRSSAG